MVNYKSRQRLSKQTNLQELVKVVTDFADKGKWDAFYAVRGDDPFEWHAEWPQFSSLLTENLLHKSSEIEKSLEERLLAKKPAEVRILVPGCGNSSLSEHLYDLGFHDIINADFSKLAIFSMLNKNLRVRPAMKWRVMDMTDLKFPNERFDAVIDKGGLDSLMDPMIGPRLGNLYLSEVKRVLAAGGKFICVTFAEPHVIDVLFDKFRFGWKMSLRIIEQVVMSPSLQTIMVVAEKDCPTSVSDISSFLEKYSVESHGERAREIHEAISKERTIRLEYHINDNVLYSVEDLRFGAKGNISVMVPGRRIKLILGEPGVTKFSYSGILLDAKENSENVIYPYAVCVVPQAGVLQWIYESEEAQWRISVNSMISRLLMVFLDSSNSISLKDVEMDLSPLIKQLAPEECDGTLYPVLSVADAIIQREKVHEVISDLTGPIIVEDVIYSPIEKEGANKDLKYRRLTFQRAKVAQSEALLSTKRSTGTEEETKQEASSHGEMEVDYYSLSSAYHHGLISGIMLISSHYSMYASHAQLKAVVVGLGAGLLPMFMKRTLPFLKIEVVELDPVVLDVAKEYFGFEEDERVKVHIGDGIQFVKDLASSVPIKAAPVRRKTKQKKKSSNRKEEKKCDKVSILVVDVPSSDTSNGLSCPAASFVEGSFLLAAKESLSEDGVMFINLVSRSSSSKLAVYLRLKRIFGKVFRMKIEEDVNEVVFVVKTTSAMEEEQLSEARNKLLAASHWWSQTLIHCFNSVELLR